jgi:hypothetical protein
MIRRAALVAVFLLGGCLVEGQFPCDSDAKCQKGAASGQCVQGFCAYEDGSCSSSLKWDNTAPAGMANQCVPPNERDLGDLARPSDLFDAGRNDAEAGVDLSVPDLSTPDLSTIVYCRFSVDTFNDGCQLK